MAAAVPTGQRQLSDAAAAFPCLFRPAARRRFDAKWVLHIGRAFRLI
jgi:hypothetical protein